MLIGLNSAISMFGGGVLAWGLIGPLLVHYGECIGKDVSEGDPKWQGMYSFGNLKNQDKETPSPRFWLLWPAVMVMICGMSNPSSPHPLTCALVPGTSKEQSEAFMGDCMLTAF